MIVGANYGFSVPIGETWVKVNLEISLNEKEIAQPKLYKVSEKVEKAFKIINAEMSKHLDKQLNEIKEMAKQAGSL